MRIYNSTDLVWRGPELQLGNSGSLLAIIVPDADWPGMWRVHTPKGHITDMVNLTRAKDAAKTLALTELNQRDEAA
jgi:hypothetical protein